MQLSTNKVLVSLIGTAVSFVLSLPPDVHRAAGVAIWFMFIDYVSGIAAARVRGEVGSTPMRKKTADKLSCYMMIIGFAFGLTILVGRPEWFSFAVWSVCLTEALSILENLRPILRKGGNSMMPIARFLDTAATFIDRIIGVKAQDALATVPQPLTLPATDASGAPQAITLSVTSAGTAPVAPSSDATPADQGTTVTGKEGTDADSESTTNAPQA